MTTPTPQTPHAPAAPREAVEEYARPGEAVRTAASPAAGHARPDQLNVIVIMTDTLPPALNFVSVSPGLPTCAKAGGAISCTLGILNNEATTTVTIVVTSTTVGTVTNTASVIGNETDPIPADNIATAETTIGAEAPGETQIYLPVIIKD